MGLVWSSLFLVLFATKEEVAPPPGGLRHKFRSFGAALRGAAERRGTWLALCFALVSGLGFEAVGAVGGPFLIDRAFSKEDVGVFYFLPVIAAMILGSLVGGWLSDRFGRKRTVAAFLVLLAAMIAVLAKVDSTYGSTAGWWLPALLAAVYVGIGLFTAASYALFMDVTDPRLGATQFSAFMGATNGCEFGATWAVGRLVPRLGYGTAFAVMAALSLLSLPLLVWIRGRRKGA